MGEAQSVSKRKFRHNPRGRMPDGSPNPIDVYIGHRILQRRVLLGISQERLASLLGISFQQVQKYEKGRNRISGSRLWDISRVLDVDVGYFYEGLNEELPSEPDLSSLIRKEDPMEKSETKDLVRAYYEIRDRKVAAEILKLLKSM